MTVKEYYKWCKKFKRKVKKECRQCRKADNGVTGALCEHCQNKWQAEINKVKVEVIIK